MKASIPQQPGHSAFSSQAMTQGPSPPWSVPIVSGLGQHPRSLSRLGTLASALFCLFTFSPDSKLFLEGKNCTCGEPLIHTCTSQVLALVSPVCSWPELSTVTSTPSLFFASHKLGDKREALQLRLQDSRYWEPSVPVAFLIATKTAHREQLEGKAGGCDLEVIQSFLEEKGWHKGLEAKTW